MIFVPETRPTLGPARVRWEEPACPLCRGERHTPVLEAADRVSGLRFAVVRCDECGLRFTSPRPDAATIRQFYRDDVPPPPDCGRGEVHLVDVLEHAHAPLALLIHVRRRLGPGGRLTVTVPNIDGPGTRWFGPAWAGLDVPRHLTHFGPRSLRRMLERAGFGDVTIRVRPRPDWLCASARLAKRVGFWRRPLRRQGVAALVGRALTVLGEGDELTVVAVVR